MKIKLPEPYDPMCNRYARDMAEYDSFWAYSQEELDSVAEEDRPTQRQNYVIENDGTFNHLNGHFLCDACYIKAGMPVSPDGWVCP